MLLIHTGLTHSEPGRVTEGLTLIAPMLGKKVFLVDEAGRKVHEWATGIGLTKWCYLLPNGNLFSNERSANPKGVDLTMSGIMREYDWDGNIVWEHEDPSQHHDARRLSGGGTVYLANVPLSEKERKAVLGGVAGTEPEGGPYGEVIREIDAEGKIVWEWPFTNLGFDRFPLHRNANRWVHGHANTVFPLEGERYLISSKVMNLIFIVNRATDEVEWHYQDDMMSGQHDVQQLENGNILLFANGTYMSDLNASEVWELNPETREIVWRYRQTENALAMFSPMVSGCQRLPSGNTLICEGAKGCVFEVTPAGNVVWEYVNPEFNTHEKLGRLNWLFRTRRYSRRSQEISGRL